MTRHGTSLLALSALAIAGWTYNVNYDTRAALDRLSELRARIAEEREAMQVLRVEWAWLNAPDRLTRLVAEHNEVLGLAPLTPDALGIVAAVPYPRGMPARPQTPPDPAHAPEAMIAAAPQAPDAAPVQPSEALVAMAQQAGESAAPRLTDATQETSQGTAQGTAPGASPAAPMQRVEPRPGDIVIAATPRPEPSVAGPQLAEASATTDKAAVLSRRAQPPASMEEAVRLALVEAGIVDAGLAESGIVNAGMAESGIVEAAAAEVPVISASVSASVPMPQARPAVWIGR